MKKKYIIERSSYFLLKDFCKLWKKYEFDNENLDYYDSRLISILDEYSFYISGKKTLRKFKFNGGKK